MSLMSKLLWVAIALALFLSIFSFFKLAFYGRKLSKRELSIRANHIKWSNRFLISIPFAVLFVECMVREMGGMQNFGILHAIHFMFVIPLVYIPVRMRWFVTGNVDPIGHGKLARKLKFVLTGALVTGSILTYQIFVKL